MGTSHALVRPGLRTPSKTGLRTDIEAAAQALVSRPMLLVVGMLGFALRAGVVLLTLPVIVLPTQVEIRFLLGSSLGSTGLAGSFYAGVGLLAAITVVVVLLALYGIARCELAAFWRVVHSPGTVDAPWQSVARLPETERGSLVMRLFVVEALTFVALLVAAIPLAVAVEQATLNEIVLPSSGASIINRVVDQVGLPLLGFAVALVAIEVLSALVSRRTLARAYGIGAYCRPQRHGPRMVAVGVIGWLFFAAGLGCGLVALVVTWDAVRSIFLASGLTASVVDLVAGLLVAAIFGLVYAAALALCGAVSAMRAGLWTLASLR